MVPAATSIARLIYLWQAINYTFEYHLHSILMQEVGTTSDWYSTCTCFELATTNEQLPGKCYAGLLCPGDDDIENDTQKVFLSLARFRL